FPVLEKLMSDYPDNFVLYVWATDWFRRQKKNLNGADYFERMYANQISRAPLMAKYALFEKAGLQLAERRSAEALQTIQRLKTVPGNDALLSKRAGVLEAEIRKSQ